MTIAEAMIVLSLLGCDDTGTTCEYIEADGPRFETVAACSAASDAYLARQDDAQYPAVVAVCAPAAELAERPVPPEAPGEVETPIPVDVAETDYLARIAAVVADYAPDRETLVKPVDAAADGALWIGDILVVGVRRAAGAINPF